MKVEILEKRRVFDNYFRIDKAVLRHELFNGGMSEAITRLNLERGESVAVLIHCKVAESVVLVTQFRYPGYERGEPWILETVAGAIDEGETPEEAAIREAKEETGLDIYSLEQVARVFLSPGGTSERITIFYAECSTLPEHRYAGNVHETEDIRLELLPLTQLKEMVRIRAIVDAKTLIAVQYLLAKYP